MQDAHSVEAKVAKSLSAINSGLAMKACSGKDTSSTTLLESDKLMLGPMMRLSALFQEIPGVLKTILGAQIKTHPKQPSMRTEMLSIQVALAQSTTQLPR
jgi:hypothetical protein